MAERNPLKSAIDLVVLYTKLSSVSAKLVSTTISKLTSSSILTTLVLLDVTSLNVMDAYEKREVSITLICVCGLSELITSFRSCKAYTINACLLSFKLFACTFKE